MLQVLPRTAPAVELREAVPADVGACGRIIYTAFRRINESRGFPPDFPNVEIATGLARAQITAPDIYAVVATSEGRVIGSNFLTEGDPIRGVGPISVDPDFQCQGVGRRLMEAVIRRGRSGRGIRLVQGAFNTVSMSLYASLGFETREPLAILAGTIREPIAPGHAVRTLRTAEIEAADRLALAVTGFSRRSDIAASIAAGTAVALERSGKLAGYMTAPGFWIANHAVAETEFDLRQLILGAGAEGAALSFIIPTRRAALFRWALAQGLRVVMPGTLMTLGAYEEPEGGYLPSVLY